MVHHSIAVVITSFLTEFSELREGEVRRTRNMRTSGTVKLHPSVATLTQQGPEAEPR